MKQGWKKVKLPEVIFFQEGPGLRKFQYTEEGIPFLNIRTLVNDRIDKTLCGHISEKEVNEKYQHFLLNEEDIICSTSGTIGKLAIVHKEDLPVMLNTSVIRFREIDPNVVFKKFIYYYLKSDLFLYQAKDAAKGQAQVNFGPSHLKKFDFILPPLPEQQRIVSILDEAFAAIAKAKANAEQNLNNARELFESYLQGVFENGNWETKKLNEITEVKDGTHDSPKYIKEGIPFVTQKNIKPDGLSFDDTKFITETDHEKFYKRSNVTYGDILISMIGANRGMAAIVDDKRVFSIKNVGLIKSSYKINMNYLLYFLKSSIATKYVLYMSNGGAQEFVGLTALRSFPIPLPPLKDQQTIVRQLDALRAETQKLEAIYQKKLDDLEELKKSILQKAFSGELKTGKAVAV